MNPDRAMYGRVTINGNKITLGYGDWKTLMIRLTAQYQKFPASSHKQEIVVELSVDKMMESESLMSGLQRAEREFQTLMADSVSRYDPNELSSIPGLTVGDLVEPHGDPIFDRYATLCLPEKRLGVSDETIELARTAYAERWPKHFNCGFPVWT